MLIHPDNKINPPTIPIGAVVRRLIHCLRLFLVMEFSAMLVNNRIKNVTNMDTLNQKVKKFSHVLIGGGVKA